MRFLGSCHCVVKYFAKNTLNGGSFRGAHAAPPIPELFARDAERTKRGKRFETVPVWQIRSFSTVELFSRLSSYKRALHESVSA